MHAVGPGLVGGPEQALSGNNQKEILKGAQLVNSQTVGSWHRPCHQRAWADDHGKQLAKHWCHKEDDQFATNSVQGVSQLEGSSDKS